MKSNSSASKIKVTSYDDLFGGANSTFDIQNIDVNKIVYNIDNFYNVKELDKLKASIKAVGLKHNLVVRQYKTDETLYELLSGHRRLKAILELVDEGELGFDTVPCIVDVSTDFEQRLTLILANSTARELTSFEKMKQVTEMKRLILELKEIDDTKIKGKTRDLIAEFLDMSTSEVARYEAIENNLQDNLKEELAKENISTDTAYEISKLDSEQQEEVAQVIEKAKVDDKKITSKDVKTIAQKEKNDDEPLVDFKDCSLENQIGIENNKNYNTVKAENTGKVQLSNYVLEPEITKEKINRKLDVYKKFLAEETEFLARQDKNFVGTISTSIEAIKGHKLIIYALEKLLESLD